MEILADIRGHSWTSVDNIGHSLAYRHFRGHLNGHDRGHRSTTVVFDECAERSSTDLLK
jgi:hypothetical protein